MPLAIGHFAVGVMGGVIILFILHKFWPKLTVRFDVFILFISGIWAMLGDLNVLVPGVSGDALWHDIFWFHYTLDKFVPDEPTPYTILFLGIMVFALGAYYIKIKN